MMLRNGPEPRYIAAASIKPIPADKTKAAETDGSAFLSAVSGNTLLFQRHSNNFYLLIVYHLPRYIDECVTLCICVI